MPKKKTTEEFIAEAKKIHGDKYDYSKVEYVNAKTKVCIICPEHGEFWQNPYSHLSGRGCRKCGRVICKQKLQIWTEETCYKAALKCHSVAEFKETYPSAYTISHKNGWYENYLWLSAKQLPSGYWNNFEHCKAAALNCSNASEFHELYGNAHSYSVKNGWIDDFFPNRQKKHNWTDELALAEAEKYVSKVDFKRGCQQAYKHVCEHGLMDKCTWFKHPVYDNSSLVQQYIDKCILKYNGFYDYSQIDIANVKSVSNTRVPIICPEHGVFYQRLYTHLTGVYPCPQCRRGVYNKHPSGVRTAIEDRLEHGIIYCYTNKKNGKKYIGQTIHKARRKRDHLRKNQRYMTLFDKILQKEGEENFTYEVLFEIEMHRSEITDILNNKEQYYIQLFNCQVPNGYNITEGGKSILHLNGWKPNEKQRKNLSEAHKGIPNPMKGKHYSEDKRKQMVAKWKKTMAKKYENGYVQQRRNIVVYRNGEYMGTFPNATEIERHFGINCKRVHYGLRKQKPIDGIFIFIHEDCYSEELLKQILQGQAITTKKQRLVEQIDKNSNIVSILTLAEASKKFGKHVSDVCHGKRKTAGGFIFRFHNTIE